NLIFFSHTGDIGAEPMQRFRVMLGDLTMDGFLSEDADQDGVLDGGEDVNGNGVLDTEGDAFKGPYILWSAGADRLFGPAANLAPSGAVLDFRDAQKCDDVTNFTR
ncbi:MAG: hypothetical protein ACREIT_11660, partial [Tepidisphaeraceae bacterium]